MSFTELSDDVLLLVCLDLPPASITNLRQVCRALNAVTRSRFLWITLLRILLSQGAVMPRYVGEYDRLDAIVLERLVRRLSLVAWNAISTIEPHNPRLHANIMFQLSITWLRLVAGNWLFVAASNDAQSTITCHDLSDPSRTAWAYLPGRVKTGEVNVQNGAIVLALGLAYEASAVHVLTLRKCTERNVLCELARIERSSHVLMLCGALVGCAIRGTANLPHLCDWKTKTVYEIPPPPGGLDIPSRRSVPHLIAMWRNDIVVVRASGLELYRFQSKPASITFLQLVEAPTIWEVAYLAVDADSASLRLPIISPKGIELLQLWHCSGDIRCTRRSLVEISSSTDSFQSGIQEAPFYNLGVGASSRRIFWISALCTTPRHKRPRLRLLHMAIPPVDVEERRITAAVDEQERRVTPHFIDFEGMPDPGIWGDAMVDFDDALGTVVVGNCFGEVSIYDHAAKQGQWSVPLTPDVADLRDPLPPFAPWEPIPLDLLPYPHHGMSTAAIAASRASRWGHHFGSLDPDRQAIWLRSSYSASGQSIPSDSRNSWQGYPGDLSWRLERMYGFPGEVLPQAYIRCADDCPDDCNIICVGERYLYRAEHRGPDFYSWSLNDSGLETDPGLPSACELQQPIRATAWTAELMYNRFLFNDPPEGSRRTRNRWQELVDRGGLAPMKAPVHRPGSYSDSNSE